MATEYNTIHAVNDIESIRINPQLYIGHTNNPTHLFEEVFNNSLDEAMNGFANEIKIIINSKTKELIIYDNGRGIPTAQKNGVDIPILVCSKLHTSGKIRKDNSFYKVSSGLHGIGLVAVAALSKIIILVVFRDGKQYTYVGKYKDEKSIDWNKDIKPGINNMTGTIIKFIPNKKYFDTLDYDYDYILRRLKLIGLFNKNKFRILFQVDNETIFDTNKIEENINKEIKSFFTNSNYVTDIFKINLENKEELLDIYFYIDKNRIENSCLSLVNTLELNRGDHIKWVQNKFKKYLFSVFKSDKELKSLKCQEDDFIIGFRWFLNCKFINAKYTSQTKNELSMNSKYFDKIFGKQIDSKLKEIFKDEDLLNIIKNKVRSYRLQLNIKRLETSKTNVKKKNDKLLVSMNLVDSEKYEDSILFIVEGESAAGTLIQCRDPQKHAIYKLRGKGLVNVETSKLEKILTNEVAKDLLLALGIYEIKNGKLNKIGDCKYSKIVILADADIDGKHIVTILLKFFRMFTPELIQEKRLYVGLTPLYGTYEKNKFVPIWNENDLKNYLDKKYNISRHKGLGEFSPNELEEIVLKNYNYICVLSN